jgi:hypothetical protein
MVEQEVYQSGERFSALLTELHRRFVFPLENREERSRLAHRITSLAWESDH